MMLVYATCSIWIGTNLTGPTPDLNMAHAPVGRTQAHHNSVVQNKHTHTHGGRACIEVVAPSICLPACRSYKGFGC